MLETQGTQETQYVYGTLNVCKRDSACEMLNACERETLSAITLSTLVGPGAPLDLTQDLQDRVGSPALWECAGAGHISLSEPQRRAHPISHLLTALPQRPAWCSMGSCSSGRADLHHLQEQLFPGRGIFSLALCRTY